MENYYFHDCFSSSFALSLQYLKNRMHLSKQGVKIKSLEVNGNTILAKYLICEIKLPIKIVAQFS